jgi:hypothetical protein
MPDAHFLTEARMKGTKVISITTEYSSTASKPLEHNADLLFGSELAAGAPTDLPHCRLSGLLLASCHLETLLGVLRPVKCLLD